MSGPLSTDSRIIHPFCLFSMYSSIMLFQESYISFSSIGGRLSAPERIALSTRVVIEKFLVLLCRDKNKVCLLCETSLKQIPAFNFICASLETISAIENAFGKVRDCQHGLYTAGGVSRVEEMILARERDGFAGKKYGATYKLFLGLLGGKEDFLGSRQKWSP
ncbi:hypothetical protein Tco_0652185 [Tanacetum coccineum]|uniref:Uncharacterized protein n=1 Tax=Tanacetum coccineum TaxID=301880 RepID=A0ABQ4WWV9_9ASTR